MQSNLLTPTSSVETALNKYLQNGDFTAVDFANALFKLHPEYAGKKAASVRLENTTKVQSSREWLSEIRSIFDLDRFSTLDQSSDALWLNGRYTIFGLSLLEPKLREQLEREGMFSTLIDEIHKKYSVNILDFLSTHGQALLEPSEQLADSVPTVSDNPLERLKEDLLGRAAYAQFLAKRLDSIAEQEKGAYSFHLQGAWGSGKSTLLNFLKEELTNSNKWVVVEFNAWRNQHIDPPWWSLMEKVFKDTRGNLKRIDRFREYWWRLNTGRPFYMVAVAILAWVLALYIIPALKLESLGDIANTAENLSTILALVTTVWSGVVAFNRSLLLSSARAAKNYTELTQDPTGEIKERFQTLIKRLGSNKKRAAIFVDDLDRCRIDYVVELLEGIQTLFKDAPVVFVISADYRWLNACYEIEYENFQPHVGQMGKSLGNLFLEKTFQFSTPIPGIPESYRTEYWRSILHIKEVDQEEALKAAHGEAQNRMGSAASEADVNRLVGESHAESFLLRRAIREEAVVRLASPGIVERLKHTLAPYLELLEPNPRVMKRLVNTYSANRALSILSEVDIELNQLARWTILSSRWPQLAAYLLAHPEQVDHIGSEELQDVPDALHELFLDEDVRNVYEERPTLGGSLNEATIEKCALMQSYMPKDPNLEEDDSPEPAPENN